VSYQQIRPGGFEVLPPVIKNLIIINGIVLLAQYTAEVQGYKGMIYNLFALHNVQSELFKPYQLVTHLFMHGNFVHFFFNMFALWMFGSMLENMWGAKRFLNFYILCGLGAAALHLGWLYLESRTIMEEVALFKQVPTVDRMLQFFSKYGVVDEEMRQKVNILITDWRTDPFNANYAEAARDYVSETSQAYISSPTVGASGAVFGCLAAFGYLFPNTLIYIYFFFPIKAKWFVILYAAAELWMGVRNSGGNIAHFAHLGGALIGFLLVLYWNKKNRRTFY
jgi:membrane associated rhomboid family serine protease